VGALGDGGQLLDQVVGQGFPVGSLEQENRWAGTVEDLAHGLFASSGPMLKAAVEHHFHVVDRGMGFTGGVKGSAGFGG